MAKINIAKGNQAKALTAAQVRTVCTTLQFLTTTPNLKRDHALSRRRPRRWFCLINSGLSSPPTQQVQSTWIASFCHAGFNNWDVSWSKSKSWFIAVFIKEGVKSCSPEMLIIRIIRWLRDPGTAAPLSSSLSPVALCRMPCQHDWLLGFGGSMAKGSDYIMAHLAQTHSRGPFIWRYSHSPAYKHLRCR